MVESLFIGGLDPQGSDRNLAEELGDLVGGDETAAVAVLARCTEGAAQGLLRRNLQSDGALDDAKGGHDRAQGWILDVPRVWDYLVIPIVLLLTETYVDIVKSSGVAVAKS